MDEQQISEVLKAYPGLQYDAPSKRFRGHIAVANNDEYDVEVDISVFPKALPLVCETSERIPPKADRHVYEDTGHFCFTTNARAAILLKKEVKTLPDFFEKMLLPFLSNNSYYEVNREYAQGEYAHGALGVVESYRDILGVESLECIGSVLYMHLHRHKRRPNDLCYCGSGLKIKRCGDHLRRYKEFRLIDRRIVLSDLSLIVEYWEKLQHANRHPKSSA
jgi:hypothetical protein